MAEPHPTATHHVPSFITAPGQTDVLMVVMSLILVLAVVMLGVLFFRLHSLPDQIAHKSNKLQAEIVGVLCLIALFTHIHIFWIAIRHRTPTISACSLLDYALSLSSPTYISSG